MSERLCVSATISSALLGAALLLHSPAQAGTHGQCSSSSQLLQVRCDEVDSGAFGPLCAEAIGYTYDAFEGAVCLVVVPTVEAPKQRRADHQGAPSLVRPQLETPADQARTPELPRPSIVVGLLALDQLDRPQSRVPDPLLAPG